MAALGTRNDPAAADEQKPIYLFVGSFLNEMARLTIKDSFSDPKMVKSAERQFRLRAGGP